MSKGLVSLLFDSLRLQKKQSGQYSIVWKRVPCTDIQSSPVVVEKLPALSATTEYDYCKAVAVVLLGGLVSDDTLRCAKSQTQPGYDRITSTIITVRKNLIHSKK